MTDGLLGPRLSTGADAGDRRDEASATDHSQRPVSPGGGRSPRARSPMSATVGNRKETERKPKKLILCFDGTGNKFHGDDSDSNILKIFRMLDRSASDQYHYYQPGIGTYVISDSLSHSGLRARIKSWFQKAKDSAVGSSFDQHVVGGYRFLMRFYQSGDEIYMFGFSRGAYIARFLAEMLDYIGLLCHGNEEMVKFAWKAFAQWQSRKPASSDDDDGEEETEEDKETRRMYDYMKGFRETFSRPVGRIRFLGLFDTVNSVPRFETAWMQRSKFPYTARSSAKVIRHAVSIDERRAKFRQDLMYQKAPKHEHHSHKYHHHMGEMIDRVRRSMDHQEAPDRGAGLINEKGTQSAKFLSPGDMGRGRRGAVSSGKDFAPYRPRSRSRQRTARGALMDTDNMSCSDSSQWEMDYEDWKNEDQDVDEVWFSGGHGDIGGGWEALDDRRSASHVPLAWMVREAIKGGLSFDLDNVTGMGCQDVFENQIRLSARGGPKPDRANRPAIQVQDEAGHIQQGQQNEQSSPELDSKEFAGVDSSQDSGPRSPFHEMMHKAHTSRIHDSLEYGGGLGGMAVTAWKFMEYLPFRRMDLQPNGSWKPIRWPLPCGETRDIPDNVRIHGSVIRRMKVDETYRPGNLIIGGGGRGVRRAKKEDGIGEWVCVAEPGDPIGEVWSRKPKETNGDAANGVGRSNGTNGVGH
ncbi:hypothetical protein QQS21_000757 [Conoideocrella luteorostrata]|uniref:T6SS Phospholipase effector Tle1-like catalytic domain-containing protein n=1 Tax=Conoideocrella luteorostrata TaxID=1105319 RepID=A0AAJ0CYI7_9HYPO|nr:hypothetical protein QQS21_000757 [Conoideocrella luteorostrata]